MPKRRKATGQFAANVALLRDTGWYVNDNRVERLWRREGLKPRMA
ncbi:hypothetical protein [Phaeobacter sp. HF9A]|nr:hypothetical protein [Phaeobacter sp. HF9A]